MAFSSTLPGTSRVPAVVFAAAAAAWLLLIVGAPYLVAHARPGSVPWRAGALTYLFGRSICHQRADRSFHAWGVQLPVCGRCLGLYAGGLFGAALAAAAARRRGGRCISAAYPRATSWRWRLLVASVPTAASLLLEIAGVWSQTPATRCLAAVPLGFVVAMLVGQHADEAIRLVWRSV